MEGVNGSFLSEKAAQILAVIQNAAAGQQDKYGRDPRRLPHRKLDQEELNALRGGVESMLRNENCAKFIERLLAKAAEITQINETLVSDDVMGLFDLVAGASTGGFYLAPGASYSTIDGDVTNGTGAVYITGIGDYKKFSLNPKYWKPHEIEKQRKIYYQGRMKDLATIGADTAVHELLHFNYGDRTLAAAVAELNGKKVSFGKGPEGLAAASKYWNDELKKWCK